jgi:hypothetical protein
MVACGIRFHDTRDGIMQSSIDDSTSHHPTGIPMPMYPPDVHLSYLTPLRFLQRSADV